MAALRQMFDHTCTPVKGWVPGNMGSIDKAAEMSANVTVDPVFKGRVVHLNSEGEFELGCTGHQMPIFLMGNTDDNDVAVLADDDFQGAIPAGNMFGLVAIGGYEIATTEFDPAQDYAYNDLLRAVASNSDATTGGRLTNQSIVLYTNAVCGVVSKPVTASHLRRDLLQFWPVFLPGSGA